VTVPREQPIPPALDASHALRDRRLVQAAWACSFAICATGVPDLLAQRWRNIPPLLAGLGALAVVLWLVRHQRRNAAVALMLTSLFGMVSLLLWQNGGLRDTALMAFPCMLVFAAMLGTRRRGPSCWPAWAYLLPPCCSAPGFGAARRTCTDAAGGAPL